MTEQEYQFGQELVFELPDGLISDLKIDYSVPLTFARGQNARYRKTPAGGYALFSRLTLDCNGPQIRTSPYFCGFLSKMMGRDESSHTPVPESGGEVIWEGSIRLPISADVYVHHPARLFLTTPKNLYGPDPLLNAVSNAEKQDSWLRAFWRRLTRGKKLGTGHAITTEGGTVSVNYAIS